MTVIDALATAARVRRGERSARKTVEDALRTIGERDAVLNCFTAVLHDAALEAADAIDALTAAGRDPGPLAGVPLAVKNLFDVAGVTTLAGSRIDRERPPASCDAAAVRALRRAGAVVIGCCNMDEYAYGFSTENTHYGATRNPHDPACMAGGSSGGSAAAVAAGFVPVALGTDTNGSIRVPAALCGVYGLKPTYGRLSRAGIVLFAPSLDHVGLLASSVRDLAEMLDVLQATEDEGPAAGPGAAARCAPSLAGSIGDLRIAVGDGDLVSGADPQAMSALDTVARALDVSRLESLPELTRARAAATIVTASEAAALRLADLRARAGDFDPLTRHRFLAGALVPAAAYVLALRFRRWFSAQVRDLFTRVDVVLTPTTPSAAPPLAEHLGELTSAEFDTRRRLGLYTQPFSFAGVPALSVPVRSAGPLPLGVQLVAAPFREASLLRVAAELERRGVTGVEPV